jgi:hypothetical protein
MKIIRTIADTVLKRGEIYSAPLDGDDTLLGLRKFLEGQGYKQTSSTVRDTPMQVIHVYRLEMGDTNLPAQVTVRASLSTKTIRTKGTVLNVKPF